MLTELQFVHTVEDLKAELSKHEGLLENLSIKYVVMFKLETS